MYVTDYLLKELKPGKVNYSPERLLKEMVAQQLNYLPLFDGLTFIGNIAEEEVAALSIDDSKDNVDYLPYLDQFYLTSQQTLWDAIRLMQQEQTNAIPVFSEEGFKYLGILTQNQLMHGLAQSHFIGAMGVSMLVSVKRQDYSMTTVANIIEANNGHFLAAIVLNDSEDEITLLVKFSSDNLLSIGETFERYGYHVIQKFYTDQKEELLQHRYAQLLKYMNT